MARVSWVLAVFQIVMLAPRSGMAAANAADRAAVELEFADGVSAEDRALIKEAIRFAQDAFVTTFGGDVRQPVAVAVTYDPNGGQFSNYARGYRIAINTWNFRGYSPLMRLMFTVHEYLHVWQSDRSGVVIGEGRAGPIWLIEGSADFVAFRAITDAGLVGDEVVREYAVLVANGLQVGGAVALPPLRELTTAPDMFAPGVGCCSYALGALAVRMLTEAVGIGALRSYFESLGTGDGWDAAFATAFGQTPDAFYAAFEAQRPALLTPAGLDVNALARSPPFNEVPAEVGVASVSSPVERGAQALLIGTTAPGAHCTLVFTSASGNRLLAYPTYADAYGTVFWLWSVRQKLARGTATADVDCGGAAVSVGVELR